MVNKRWMSARRFGYEYRYAQVAWSGYAGCSIRFRSYQEESAWGRWDWKWPIHAVHSIECECAWDSRCQWRCAPLCSQWGGATRGQEFLIAVCLPVPQNGRRICHWSAPPWHGWRLPQKLIPPPAWLSLSSRFAMCSGKCRIVWLRTSLRARKVNSQCSQATLG